MQGLKPSQLAALTRLFNRRFPAAEVYTVDQARELSLLSRALGRQVGLLIDRKGRVQMVIVGEAGSIVPVWEVICTFYSGDVYQETVAFRINATDEGPLAQ